MAAKLVELKNTAFKSACSQLEADLSRLIPDVAAITSRVKVINAKAEALVEAIRTLMEEFLKNGSDDEYLEAEEMLTRVQIDLDAAEKKAFEKIQEVTPASTASVSGNDSEVKLPKLEIQKFTGDVRQWLSFWAGFEVIHNANRPDAEKYQRLLQCIPEHSAARKCIDSFPVCAKNYRNAIGVLKETFGREKMLVKVYVRDLLQNVIKNALHKSSVDLVELVPQLSSQIRNLEELGVTSDKCEDILYPVVESCLPEEALLAWQRSPAFEEKLEAILKFLHGEVQNQMERGLAKMVFSTTSTGSGKAKNGKNNSVADIPTASALVNVNSSSSGGGKCAFCNGNKHKPSKCYKAKKMSLKEKQEALRKNQLCYVCMKSGHRASSCSENITCKSCSGRHYAVMCDRPAAAGCQQDTGSNPSMMASSQGSGFLEGSWRNNSAFHNGQFSPISQVQPAQMRQPQQAWTSNSAEAGASPSEQSVPLRTGFSNVNSKNRTALLTMLVNVDTPNGVKTVRAFIDEGSDESYVEQFTAAEVHHERVGAQVMRHQLFGGEVTAPTEHSQLKICIRRLDGSTSRNFVFNSIPKIAHRILKPVHGPWMNDLKQHGVHIHDQSGVSDEVQFLFGIDVASQIWGKGFHRVNAYMYARETIFGWVIGGVQPVKQPVGSTGVHMATTMMLRSLPVEELWSLETLGITEDSKRETRQDLEKAAMDHFEKTVKRDAEGRYEVELPWIKGHKEIKNNKSQAVARLKTTTLKLKADGYLEKYNQVFHDWLQEGIIEMVPSSSSCLPAYYLPHRHVVKEGSTTPVRPVFDASAKVKGSISMNECQEKGPNLLMLIPEVMSRFRLRKVGVTADIKKAFLQIGIAEKDRSVLRFCWWKDLSCNEIIEFQHRRVVFGVTSSPFLLAATLQYHLNNCEESDRRVAETLLRSFYVDNSVCSFDSRQEAEEFKLRSQGILKNAKFDLRGWEMGPSEEDKLVPVLGMIWNTKEDALSLCLEGIFQKTKKADTKRGLLSIVNSVFDPMGFVSPFTITPKLLFQKCCEMKLKWDDKLPDEILEPLAKWKENVALLESLQIPRCVSSCREGSLSLQIFSDASSFAFSCCVFLRVETVGRPTSVQLVMSKSRVAPIKTKQTIPRLELLGCLIGVRLTEEVKRYLRIPEISCTYWTDSSTALAWIVNDKNWGRFVQNRVNEIRQFTSSHQWRHVPGDLNPADLPSRGCTAERLLQLQWWEGPEWLKMPMNEWPQSSVKYNEKEILDEEKKIVVSSHVQIKTDALNILQKYSNFHFALRVVSVVMRYVNTLRKRAAERKLGCIERLQLQKTLPLNLRVPESTAAEIVKAESIIVRYIQRTGFTGIDDPRLKKLSVYSDEEGIIRIKTQLFFGDDNFGVRCPAVLPHNHDVVRTIIQTEHRNNSHAGVQTLMMLLRQKFWILKGRRTISAVVNSCGRCRRFTAKRCEVPGAPLPRDRIKDTCAFDVTGVDLLGPLFLRGGDKTWVVLFTCAVFRCVHLEVTSSLSTEGFLKAFRRFVDRRGRPSKVYSDNGLNFVGCQNLFQQVDWEEVQRYASVRAIEWSFNPPTAAWWGGWWERLVGLSKNLLRRILGKSVVNYEDFATILCDVEATLNRRPLGYLTDVGGDLEPLCPAFYMKDNPSCGLPEADAIDSNILRDHAKRCQLLREALRGRFRKEYLAQLKHHATCKEVTVGVGDVVIVEADNQKRTDWPLGLVKEVYPGRDGKVRTALVKTKTGEFLRPVQRLFILETKNVERKKEEAADLEDGSCGDECAEEKKTRSGRKVKKPQRLNYAKI